MAKKKPNSQKLIYSEEIEKVDYNNEFDNEFYADSQSSNVYKVKKPKIKKSNRSNQSHNQIQMDNKRDYGTENNENDKQKKERNWVINTGNMAIIASSLSIVIDVIHKLLRMILYAYSGLIIFMYIISGILSVFALIACIKNAFKYKQISIDAYFTGISFIMLILI